MKITKTVKYNYKLTEGTLEKDIDKFILDARRGDFGWDYKNGGEGLKIIKQYFRIIGEKFSKGDFEECNRCYKKLILFLFDSSVGRDEACFGYEDLLAKVSGNFDGFIEKYFVCLVKVCSVEELVGECLEYAISSDHYGFDSDSGTLLKTLSREELKKLIELMILRVREIEDKDERSYFVWFIMEIVGGMKDKVRYFELCEEFRDVLSEGDIEEIKGEWDDGGLQDE